MATISPAPSVEAMDLVANLERLVTFIRGLTPNDQSLSLTSASTLRMIERDGPQRISELAQRQAVTQPAMTQLVTRLERDGLAERRGSAEDARVVLVGITAAGRDLLTRRREARAQRLSELLDTLPAGDRRAIVAAMPALNLLADLGTTERA